MHYFFNNLRLLLLGTKFQGGTNKNSRHFACLARITSSETTMQCSRISSTSRRQTKCLKLQGEYSEISNFPAVLQRHHLPACVRHRLNHTLKMQELSFLDNPKRPLKPARFLSRRHHNKSTTPYLILNSNSKLALPMQTRMLKLQCSRKMTHVMSHQLSLTPLGMS